MQSLSSKEVKRGQETKEGEAKAKGYGGKASFSAAAVKAWQEVKIIQSSKGEESSNRAKGGIHLCRFMSMSVSVAPFDLR